MSDQPADSPATGSPAVDQPDAAPKPTETVEFWKQKAREQEKRAKENADAARRLGEIEDAQKSDAERLAEAERKAVEAEARVLRRDVAIEHKLTADDAALLDAITDEGAMRSLAARLAPAESDSTRKNHVPNEGKNPRPGEGDELRTFARSLFARQE